jgi:probable F420-dependent oxidoreductase
VAALSPKLDVGVMIPSQELPDDPAVLKDFAQAAEDLGYSWLVLVDHVLGTEHARRDPPFSAGFYDETHAFHEPFVTFGYLAGTTKTIGFRTEVLVLPQRETALVAKQAAQLAFVSGGRLTLGCGLGWNWVEYQALAADWSTRGRRMEEQVELMRRLWREPSVDFSGEFHRVDRGSVKPHPPADIPVWIGGFTEPAMRRAVKIGDGFVFASCDEQAFAQAEVLHGLMNEAGRAADDFPWDAQIEFSPGPGVWERDIARWRALGGTNLTLRFGDATADVYGIPKNDFSSLGQYTDALREFKSAMSTIAP